jgi:hypothetical protein
LSTKKIKKVYFKGRLYPGKKAEAIHELSLLVGQTSCPTGIILRISEKTD